VSLRRSAVGIPLLTLFVSFGSVLAFGGMFGTSAAAPEQPAPATGVVRIVIDPERLVAGAPTQQPFPGLRISMPAVTPVGSGAGDGDAPAADVLICVSKPAAGWQVVNTGWAPATAGTSTVPTLCHRVDRTDGRLQPVELWLAKL
jgi:hypothetical protein